MLATIGRSMSSAVDVAFRGTSTAGRRPEWLRTAGQPEWTGWTKTGEHSLRMRFAARQFGDVAKQYFEQSRLFDDGPRPEQTAFDVFGSAADDVISERGESERFDSGVLRRFARFKKHVFEAGIESVTVDANADCDRGPIRLDAEFPAHASRLSQRTPKPRRARIAGRLDMIQRSTMAFLLILPGGARVRGTWKQDDFEMLRELVDKEVAATGIAVFRPSGTLLRIDAESLAPQRDGDALFAALPEPLQEQPDQSAILRDQGRRGGVASTWKVIPAEESDDEFIDAVMELS